jgi:DNA-binding Lrp family transcriptional regulator
MSMDKLDLKILSALGNYSRISYRKIGEKTGITTKSVKARVDKMIASGVIERFLVKVNPAIFGYGNVCMLQVRPSQASQDIANQLSLLGDIVVQCQCVGGISIFVVAIKDGSEEKVKLLVDSLRPAIMKYRLVKQSYNSTEKLNRTDFGIIKCLLKDPRMKISDIAVRVDASAKTISRRLAKLVKNQVLEFSFICNPSAMKGYIQFVAAISVERARYREILEHVYNDFKDYFFLPPPAINQDDMIVLILACENIYTVDSILSRIESYHGVLAAETLFMSKIVSNSDWIAREIDRIILPSRRAVVPSRRLRVNSKLVAARKPA